jgi:opacity protein-like surface antigen
MLINKKIMPLVTFLSSALYFSAALAYVNAHPRAQAHSMQGRPKVDYKATAASAPILPASPWKYYVGLGGGKHLFETPDDERVRTGAGMPADKYHPKRWDKKSFAVTAEAGVILPTHQDILSTVDLGLEYIGGFNGKVKGNITEYSQPGYTNYNYSEKVDTHALFAVAHLNFATPYPVYPFVFVGVGAALNRAYGYEETSLLPPNYTRRDLGFKDQHKTHFAWEVGAGLAWKFLPSWELRLSDRYSDYGNAKLGKGRASANRLGDGPKVKLRGQTVLLVLRKTFAWQ